MKDLEDYLEERIIPYKIHRRNKCEEDKKTMQDVFDKRTLMAFYKLLKREVIKFVEFPIAKGKEAVVFRGVTPDEKLVAIKVYRMTTLYYKSFMKYLQGDPRFDYWYRASKNIIYVWAQKEFKNLEKFSEIKVRVPKPIAFYNNIVVMSYIGSRRAPAPQLKYCELDSPRETYEEIIEFIGRAYSSKIVHADLSEYNILMHRGKPYFIDCAQAVPADHPLYYELLMHDIKQIVKFFSDYGLGSYKDLLSDALRKVMKDDVSKNS